MQGRPVSAAQDPVTGPFETEAEVLALPAVQAIRAASRAVPFRPVDAHNARLITEACDRTGVVLGAYDRRIVAWLAGWEPQTCAVIAGMISRAAAAAPGERERASGG